ncbi:MAG: 30S ribosomal protein S6, partial [Puniceicoccales bacterium]
PTRKMSQTATTKRYRATFILDTRNYTEAIETLIDSIKEQIASTGANVTDVDNLGTKEFIRVTDRKFPAGIYVQYTLEAESSVPAQIHERFRLDRTVNRIVVQSA